MYDDVAHCGCCGCSGCSCDYSRFNHCVASVSFYNGE